MLALSALLLSSAATSPVLLGGAADFAILTKAGISTVPSSSITGNIGCSPIAATALTGFSLSSDTATAGQFATSTQVSGKAYAANYAVPSPSKLTTAIGDLETAYTDAAGRSVTSADKLNIGAGSVTGETFTAGVHTWGSSVNFNSKIYINGTSSDIFIFQMSGNLIVTAGAEVVLVDDNSGKGTPNPANIVWQVAGHVKVGAGAHLEGIILVKNQAEFSTKASLNGRILAQTAVTLDQAVIVAPPTPAAANSGQSNNEIAVNKTNNNLIVGLVVGLGGGLILLGMLAFFYYKYLLLQAAKTKAAVPVNEVVIAPAGVTVANSKRV